jgi:2-phosphoglycerate kinase
MQNSGTQLDWQVLLIGGGSGVGKTAISQILARQLGVFLLSADDVRLAFQHTTTPEQQPALHLFWENREVWQQSPQVLCNGLIEVGKVVSHALEIIVAHHITIKDVGAVIIEGDGILPGFAAQDHFEQLPFFAGFSVKNELRSVFLYEPDEDVLLDNMLKRGRGFESFSLSEQQTQVRMHWLYGQWIRQEAQKYGLPVVEARPWATVIERILGVL